MAQQQGSPPEKRSNRGLWVYLAIVGVLLVALARVTATRDGQVAGSERTPTPTRAPVVRAPTPTPRPTTVQVWYVVAGSSAGATITYSDGRGGIHQTSQKLPWKLELTVPIGAPVSISAQNNVEWGAVGCGIVVGDDVVSKALSDIPYGVASCSGIAGLD